MRIGDIAIYGQELNYTTWRLCKIYSTQIPACLWFLARNKSRGERLRDRRGEVLFIDARGLVVMR